MTTETGKDRQINLRQEKLKEFLEPGEVFLTNGEASQISPEGREQSPRMGPGGMPTSASAWANRYRETGKYESVRIIGVAFDIEGNLIPDMRAIVGIPKPIAS